MKLSLAWIFDHIDADWRSCDVDALAKKFNSITAEIERVEKFSFDFVPFALATVENHSTNGVTVTIPEWKETAKLSPRTDLAASGFNLSECCLMVKKEGSIIRWATVKDFGLDKDGLMPIFDTLWVELAGGWKQKVESQDILLEVDNKSLTHRPDMWGHRGFAREISSYLNVTFKDDKEFLVTIPVEYFKQSSTRTDKTPFVIINQVPEVCDLFAGLHISSIAHRPSSIYIAFRLMRVGARPIDGIVDLSNYVMFDWSKPTHAYDADKLVGKKVVIRRPSEREKLVLLGDEEIELDQEDAVVADEKRAICLAGIKGGKEASVNSHTKSLFFESANWEPSYVRKSSLRHKNRNDSSTRFEKSLDPNLAEESIRRFVNLAEHFGFEPVHAGEIICVGEPAVPAIIEVEHSYFERAAGIGFAATEVIQPLEKLGFSVAEKKSGDDSIYYVTVPTYRSSKDIKIKDDLVEEVIRMYGFEHLPPTLPPLKKKPENLTPLLRLRRIKEFLAYGKGFVEQQNYAMFDEKFLQSINFTANSYLSIVNPVSEQFSRMVSTLLLGLFKNVVENAVDHDRLSFFEIAKVWKKVGEDGLTEQKRLDGIFFEKRKAVDFYACKEVISELLRTCCSMQNVEWRKPESLNCQIFNPHQTADLFFDGEMIGRAGKVNPAVMAKLDILPESDAFVFQLDADFLLKYHAPVRKLKPLAKYQENSFDLSFFVPLTVTTAQLEKVLAAADTTVTDVTLVDFFEKEAWADKRSLAFRVWIRHDDRTMTKEEIEAVRMRAIEAVNKLGAQLR